MKISLHRHLTKQSKAFYKSIMEEFCLDDAASKRILLTACEALDLMNECQKQIDKSRLIITDKWGQLKSNPLLSTLRDSRSQFLSALRQLELDMELLKNPIPGI